MCIIITKNYSSCIHTKKTLHECPTSRRRRRSCLSRFFNPSCKPRHEFSGVQGQCPDCLSSRRTEARRKFMRDREDTIAARHQAFRAAQGYGWSRTGRHGGGRDSMVEPHLAQGMSTMPSRDSYWGGEAGWQARGSNESWSSRGVSKGVGWRERGERVLVGPGREGKRFPDEREGEGERERGRKREGGPRIPLPVRPADSVRYGISRGSSKRSPRAVSPVDMEGLRRPVSPLGAGQFESMPLDEVLQLLNPLAKHMYDSRMQENVHPAHRDVHPALR